MVKVGLQICATLENVEELKTSHPNYTFFLKLRCTSCGESTNKWHDITESERVQIPSRTTNDINFCIKCKMCGRENSMNIIDKSNGIYQNNDSGKLKTVVVFDCRGVEPYQFLPREGWIVKTIDNGQCFENVDLSEDDWVEYDQKNRNCVGIYEFKSQFVKLKL